MPPCFLAFPGSIAGRLLDPINANEWQSFTPVATPLDTVAASGLGLARLPNLCPKSDLQDLIATRIPKVHGVHF
jgi:hypothetical protein